MNKKYQIFISSTYMDLKNERQQAVQTILREGHIPIGMEFFGQDDRKQWEVIKEWIADSDIVLIMIKNRYGTICHDTGISYTQMEYEYAQKINKPIIKVVFNDNIDISDNPEKMRAFRSLILKDCVAGPITEEGEMVQRIVNQINQYSKVIEGGWYRHADSNDSYYEKKYKMIQFLMFAEDAGQKGHNRLDVLPKIMMLQEMKKDFNPVEIGKLDIAYTLENNKSNPPNVFDGKRVWQMSSIRNIGGKALDTYSLYLAADRGERGGAQGILTNSTSNRKMQLSDRSYGNHGISCWKWNIYPPVADQQLIDSIKIEDYIEGAWNLGRKQEIIYFLPKNFGEKIGILNIVVETGEIVPLLEMEMFEIGQADREIYRKSIGFLDRIKTENKKHKYGITLDHIVKMDRVYYIVIKRIV